MSAGSRGTTCPQAAEARSSVLQRTSAGLLLRPKGRATKKRAPQLYLCGRGLGSSSAINAQVSSRGMLEDSDRWGELGCTGWSSAEVLPTFMRLEDDLNYGDQPYHGRGGPIPINRDPLEQWGAVSRAVREVALALGYQWSDDRNAPHRTGVTAWASNSRAGMRISTNDAYLEPARSRPNLVQGGTNTPLVHN